MLEEKKFESWSDFQEEIQNLVREQRQGILEEMVGSAYFFRGQSNAAWPLETSLERLLGPDQSMLDYYALIHGIQPEIETFTNKHWDLPGFEEYTDSLSSPSRFTSADQVSEYMLYLRHHGFPSPLLDWSYSPYVAAFFAFRDIGSNTESVAIFAYTIPNPGDLPPPNEPRIAVHWGREVRTNKRHYLQQSVYTTCKVPDGKNSYYTSNEKLY